MSQQSGADDTFRYGVCWLTDRIAFGRFATPERAAFLRSRGITHILNVSDAPSVIEAQQFGFDDVINQPIEDLSRISDDLVFQCCDVIDSVLRSSFHHKIYVHCTAGQNRSPTMVWLFLIACGTEPETAKRMIVSQSPDAVPGHNALVDDELIARVVERGQARNLAMPNSHKVES
jgi:hypothetical protein